MQNLDSTLADIRDKIDNIDDQILALLKERIALVHEVGELKTTHMDEGISFIRPGREATMLRRISNSFEDEVTRVAVAQIWRVIIASAINLEESTCISALSFPGNDESYWLAREYFGSFTKMEKRPTVMEILNDVFKRQASVGVIPIWDNDSPRPWWSRMVDEKNPPHIFATLPFVQKAKSERSPLMALGYVEPEPTGNDESYWVIETDEKVPFSEVRPILSNAGIEYKHCERCRVIKNPTIHHHLLRVKGFVNAESPEIERFVSLANEHFTFSEVAVKAHFLGAYACPIEMYKVNKEVAA